MADTFGPLGREGLPTAFVDRLTDGVASFTELPEGDGLDEEVPPFAGLSWTGLF